jgi:hypothetical protein
MCMSPSGAEAQVLRCGRLWVTLVTRQCRHACGVREHQLHVSLLLTLFQALMEQHVELQVWSMFTCQ